MLRDLLFNWKNRRLASPEFRSRAGKNPLGQWFARYHARRLFHLAGGFIHSQVLYACADLDLFEQLAKRPLHISELVANSRIDERRLRRLLNAAAALDLVSVRAHDRYGLGPLGAAMVGNESVLAFVRHHIDLYRDLEDPTAFFRGEVESSLAELWTYAGGRDEDSEAALTYSNLMEQSQRMVSEQVLDAFSFEDVSSLIDIGGGTGAFARAAAERWPDLAVTVADLPTVAELARRRLQGSGLERRIDVVGLDVTTAAIPGNYDVASLIRIVHDHDDGKVLSILEAARNALAPGGRLLIAEPLASRSAAGRLNDVYFQVYLLAMGSGRPRRYREIKKLLKSAGFGSVRRRRTRVPMIASVIVASP